MTDKGALKVVVALFATSVAAAILGLVLGGCALPLRVQASSAPMAAQVKALSHVPLSAEQHPRDVTDEDGFPTVGTRIMVKGNVEDVVEILRRLSR